MKKRIILLLVAVGALLALAACQAAPESADATAEADAAAETSEPVATVEATPEAASETEPAQATVDSVELYFVAIGDNGESGEVFGCDDSIVAVEQQIEPTVAPLEVAIQALLDAGEFYGETELYNALDQSDLTIDGIQVEDGTAYIAFSGDLRIAGTCDVPRVQEQITRTALQFSTVDKVEILLDGRPLSVVLEERGEIGEEGQGGGGTGIDTVNLYFVALEDAGESGEEIGCGDSLVPVEVSIDPTIAPLQPTFEALFDVKDEYYGSSGLYNALHNSGLRYEQGIIYDDGTAVIDLSGSVEFAGECDLPRFRAQLEQTALQFDTVDRVAIFINGEPLDVIIGATAGSEIAAAAAASEENVQLFFIAEGDDGASGEAVGCGDSLIPVDVTIDSPSGNPVVDALNELLAIDDPYVENGELYNPISEYDLSVVSVNVGDDGTAMVILSGEFHLIGECFDPLLEAQLKNTVTQFDGIDEAVIIIGGVPLETLTDMRG